jgi:MFS family permease
MTVGPPKDAAPVETSEEATTAEARPSLRAWYILALSVIATLFGFVDRQVLVVLVEPIKHDLGLSDGQIGIIQGLGPGLLAGFGVLLVGWLTDRTARQMIFAAAVLAWSIATALCGLAHSFWQLVGASIAIGIGEGALGPVLYSIFPDLFPGRSRITANMVYVGASMVGGGLGIMLAGAAAGFAQAHGHELPFGLGALAPWRTVFILVALPGLPLALVIAGLGPIRRAVVAEATAAHSSLAAYLKDHWQAQAGILVTICSYGAGLYALLLWGPVYVMRVLKASPAEAGAGFGLALIAGSLAGVIGGGLAARWLAARQGGMAPMRVLRTAMVVALVPTVGLLAAAGPMAFYLLSAVIYAVAMGGVAMVPTAMQDLTPPGVRGRMLSVSTLTYTASAGLGPIVVGLVSDHVPPGSHGLLWAIIAIAVPGFAIAAGAMWLADKAFRRTTAEFSADAV